MSGAGDEAEALLRLPAQATSAAEARWFVQELLRHWGVAAGAEVATLLASELATNSVRHGGSTFELRLSLRGGQLRIGVADAHPGHPVRRPAPPDAEAGRGLQLVDALSEEWGVDRREPAGAGKCVWFVLPAGQRAPGCTRPVS